MDEKKIAEYIINNLKLVGIDASWEIVDFNEETQEGRIVLIFDNKVEKCS
jgi:hypothetical protein